MNQASNDAALAELRLRLEAHQRMLARWEAKVARQLEKIVGLQKGVSRTFSTESAPATPFPPAPGMQSSIALQCIDDVQLCACDEVILQCLHCKQPSDLAVIDLCR